jgi:uncharacterized membrane protein YGL010W
VPAVLKRFLANYIARHQCRWNQLLHLIGVPLTFVASAVLLALGMGWWALGAFVGGYALQFLGHAVEGNDAGELILVKRWLGRPYTEFGPRANRLSSND